MPANSPSKRGIAETLRNMGEYIMRNRFSFPLIALFMLAYAFSLPAFAGTITLTIDTRTSITGQQISSEFSLRNTGTESAWNVSLQANFLGQIADVAVTPELPAGSAAISASVNLTLPPDHRGAFPIFATVTYHDASSRAFFAPVVGIVRTSDAEESRLTMQGRLAPDGKKGALRVKVTSLDAAAPHEVTLTCHASPDVSVAPRSQQARLSSGSAEADFRLVNRTGSPGATVNLFLTAEYAHQGKRYLASTSLPAAIDLLPAASSWILRFKVFGGIALVAAGFIFAFFAQKQDERRRFTLDLFALFIIELFIFAHITPQHLLTQTVTAGGDTASHYYTLWYLRHELLPRGVVSGWTPGNYAGFPLLQMYFPLPFVLMSLLDLFMPLQVAFKFGTLLGVFLLPVAAYLCLRLLRAPFPGPAIGAALTLPFLFNTSNSMWGGNLLSTLAGEFSYSLSLSLSLILLGSLYQGCLESRHVIRNALLVFLVGFSHGYTLLFMEAISLFFLLTPRGFFTRLAYLFKVYALGGMLLAFWLLPLLMFGKYTSPYHLAWVIYSYKEILPDILLPVAIAAIVGTIGLLAWHWRTKRRGGDLACVCAPSAVGLLWFGALIAAFMFIAAPKLGVVDIRYVPCAQLMACLLAALGLGWLGSRLPRWSAVLFLLVAASVTILWTAKHVGFVSDWTRWNYSGFEAKPAYPIFAQMNRALRGAFQDPRVVFEHSEEHNTFGSSRAFESLPFFSGRATLEGVYHQASPSSPFVFYLQSEVSKDQSCPFRQYYCTTMDFARARRHLRLFNVTDLILRTDEAKAAIRTVADYALRQTVGAYELWMLSGGSRRYVEPLAVAPVLYPTPDWKREAYRWFMNDAMSDVPLAFVKQADDADRRRFSQIAHSLDEMRRMPLHAPDCRVNETIRNDEILIDTTCLNRPLLVKMSYHPNWKAEGADRVYLAAPSFMLIFPTQERVRLYYGATWPNIAGDFLTVIGLLMLALNAPMPGTPRQSAWMKIAARVGLPREIAWPRLWNPNTRTRYALLLAAAALGVIGLAGFGYSVYANDPNRWFNAAVALKDAQKFEQAQAEFRRVIREADAIGGMAMDSAYYIAICDYLAEKNDDAIRGFQELIRNYPTNSRIPEALYHIGLCHFRAGREADGIAQMREVIARYPRLIWAKYARDRLNEHSAL